MKVIEKELNNSMQNDVQRILFTKEDIEKMLDRLGKEITETYRESVKKRKLIFVGVLKGSFIFLADLIRRIDLPLEVLFLQATSYGSGSESSGRVRINMELDQKLLADADVLFVEDILDSGRTLKYLSEYFAGNGAHSVKICTMLDKPARRVVDVKTDFLGYVVEDEFLIGYGLDFDEIYRNLPYIGILKREKYEK